VQQIAEGRRWHKQAPWALNCLHCVSECVVGEVQLLALLLATTFCFSQADSAHIHMIAIFVILLCMSRNCADSGVLQCTQMMRLAVPAVTMRLVVEVVVRTAATAILTERGKDQLWA
jgi:hypothetical protein